MPPTTEYILIVLGVVLSAFFSGSETGFYCMNRIRLRFRESLGSRTASILRHLSSDPRLTITTFVIGTNVGNYVAAVFSTNRLRMLGLERWADFYSTLIMTPVLLVLSEVIPKTIYQRRADTLMSKSAWPVGISKVVFYPLSVALRWLSTLPTLLLSKRESTEEEVFNAQRFRFFLGQGAAEGVVTPYQKRMAENLMNLKSFNVTRAMIPLDEVVTIESEATREKLMDVLGKHRFSRIPVLSDDGKSIEGVINILDVVCARGEQSISELARTPQHLPAHGSVAETLYGLQESGQQMGVIIDRRGNTLGIVTVKDLVEEIVGELRAW